MDPVKSEFNAMRHKDHLMNRRQVFGAIGGAAVLATGAWYASGHMRRADYATVAGQTRDITLDDATVVNLGSRSAINLSFVGNTRGIHLLQGEAFITVAPRTEPFSVSAMNGAVRMNAGRVNIGIGSGNVSVAVAEQVAAIDVANIPIVELGAGWGTTYDKGAIRPPEGVDAENMGSWRQGQLFFHRTPLVDVLANIERWRGGRISLWSSDAAAIPVSGIFDTSDPDAALTAVVQTLRLNVTHLPGNIAIIRA